MCIHRIFLPKMKCYTWLASDDDDDDDDDANGMYIITCVTAVLGYQDSSEGSRSCQGERG